MKKLKQKEMEQFISRDGLSVYRELFKHVFGDLQVELYAPKESIVSFHNPISKLYLLVKGKAKIYMTHEDGKSSLIQFLQKGDFIGELTLLQIEKQHKDVIAINECICLSVPMKTANNRLLTDPDFLIYLNRYLGAKLLKRTEFFAKNQNYELKNRLAAYILLTECDGIYKEKHTETAEFLGISYRHLLYTLNKLQKEQYIDKTKKGYVIEREKLQQLAKDI